MGTFVQQGEAEQLASNTTACSINLTFTGGNAIVWWFFAEHQTATVTIAGGGNTYDERSDNGMPLTLALPAQLRGGVALNIAGGNYNVTATPSTACANKVFYVAEYSGVATSAAVEFADALNQSTGTTRNAGTQSNTAAGTVVAMGMDFDLLATPTADGTYNSRTAVWDFGTATLSARPEDLAVASGGSRSATWGMNNGAESLCGMIFLLDAGGGGGGGSGMQFFFDKFRRRRPAPFAPGNAR